MQLRPERSGHISRGFESSEGKGSLGTRFTVQVSRAQRVGEARVSGINFVFDIWGIGVGYWFCVSFFFRGGFLAELLRSRRFGGFSYLPGYLDIFRHLWNFRYYSPSI